MTYATNGIDGTQIWFEDAGGHGAAVVIHGGLVDTIDLLRRGEIAQALDDEEFRLILVDHRGVGRSDHPDTVEAYSMALRVADATAVLDAVGLERAHFIGTSYGARLGFGLGEHAPERVRSLIMGGQQPYAINPEGPLVRLVTESLARSVDTGTLEPFIAALEESGGGRRVPEDTRAVYLEQDPVAMNAASSEMIAEGDISPSLGSWQMPCLIFVGEDDMDFVAQARRAAQEIPSAEFVLVPAAGHMGAHLSHEIVLPAIFRTLRRG